MEITKDRLTGLYDRNSIIQAVEAAFRNKGFLGVALMDLDFFTNINQQIGFENGDWVLRRIASSFPKGDGVITARYGADEFLFLFSGMGREEIASYMEGLREVFRQTRFLTWKPYEKVRLHFSMGAAYKNEHISSPFLLLKAAEAALAGAKKNGRNRTEHYPDQEIIILEKGRVCKTLIGKSLKGTSKEQEPAFTASIAEPYGVELDLKGELLLVDRSNHQIKRISKGKISTVAGCGESGYSGDGGDAARARLCKPSGVCVDEEGSIYVADTGNHRIRKIQRGNIVTVAGCGENGYTGDGGNALLARLSRPGGVVSDDKGNLYTNDYGNNVIRRIDRSGKISSIAGNGEFGYSGDDGVAVRAALNKPYGLYVDRSGIRLFIADYGNHCIRQVDLCTGRITTLCGDGTAGYSGDGGCCRMARLNGPFWVYEKENMLFIADTGNHCIRLIDLMSEKITTVAGNGSAGYRDHEWDMEKIRLNIPAGMAVKRNALYVADYGNNAVREIYLPGKQTGENRYE